MSKTVLIIDDDAGLRTLLKIGLERDGFEVLTASGGEEGLRKAYAAHPDVVILDIMMPVMDGWTVCQRLRQLCEKPIVMLTARSGPRDIVKGLELGADEYVTKPCSLSELQARVRKALQHQAQTEPDGETSPYDDGCLHIDPKRDVITRCGAPVDLTPTESRLLAYLVRHRDKIVPHRELLTHVWGPQYADEVRYLSVYIRYLREKIEANPSAPEYILTKHRVGYYFHGHAVA